MTDEPRFTLAKRVEQAESLILPKPDPAPRRRMVCTGNECSVDEGDH